jgi:hypothetical protein
MRSLLDGVAFKGELKKHVADGGVEHGDLAGLGKDDHKQYIRHSLADAANDFLVGSGPNKFVKKTLAETGAILETDIDHGSIQGLSDDDHTQYFLANGSRSITGNIDWSGGNVTYVPLGGDIQTYVTAASAGDTLVLASGVYTITSSITVDKQLNIRGQGSSGFVTAPVTPSHGTLITSTTASVTAFVITSDNVRIADLSVNLTGDSSVGISTTNNLQGIVFNNIDVIVNCSGPAVGFTALGTDVVMRDLTYYCISSNGLAAGALVYNNSSTTRDAVIDCFSVTGTVQGAATYAYAFACLNQNVAQDITLNINASSCIALSGTPLDIAVACSSTTTNNATINAYLCTFDGADYDVYQDGTNVMNIGGSILVNNTTTGTITYRAAMAAGLGVFSTSVTTDTISEYTGAAGVTIDGVVMKDDGWTASADCTTTGNLYIDRPTVASLFIRADGSATNNISLLDAATAIGSLTLQRATGEANLRIDAQADDNTSASTIDFFRTTDTSGTRLININLGDNTATIQHSINAGTGDVDLCQQAGQTTIGGTGGAEKLTVNGDASIGDGGTTNYVKVDSSKLLSFQGTADIAASVNVPVCLDTYVDVKERLAEYNVHGGIDSIDTAHDLSAGNLVTTVGTGKIMLVINAGGDLVGDITITGTTVDRDSGAETGADTDTLTIDSATTDNSDTDASGNIRHAFTGAYITSKWFKGIVTISSADTAVTDMDTYQVSFEQWNDSPSYTLTTLDMNAKATNSSAWMYAYLYTLEVTGDKCDITRLSTLDLPAAEVAANKYYRLRRGGLATTLNGTTDGMWVDVFPGPLASAYWEDINLKVWATIKSDVYGEAS